MPLARFASLIVLVLAAAAATVLLAALVGPALPGGSAAWFWPAAVLAMVLALAVRLRR